MQGLGFRVEGLGFRVSELVVGGHRVVVRISLKFRV